MIEENDKVLICLSGGKDSWALLETLRILQKKSPFKFSLHTLIVNPGFANFKTDKL
jgi:tRNA 2-thiocytidine biosynthesis protein TtcA